MPQKGETAMTEIRILQVVGAMNRGGAETMIMNLYRAMDRQKIQFDFLELKPGESDYSAEIRQMGGRILKAHWSQSPTAIIRTLKELRGIIMNKGPFAVVHAHVLFGAGVVMLAAKLAGVESRITHSHSTNSLDQRPQAILYRIIARNLLKKYCTGEIACSNDAGEYLFGVREFKKKGIVIRNAVNLEHFYPRELQAELDSALANVNVNNRIKLISVARLEPVKNHAFLLDIASELNAMSYEFEMIFIGDGSLRVHLEAEVERKGLLDRVFFWGTRGDIADIMRQSDCLLLPSLYEGLPVTLVEAQASGLRCLVSATVSEEADLGLDLVEFVPLDSPKVWAKRIMQEQKSSISLRKIQESLDAAGYTVEESLKKLLAVYNLK